MDISSCPCNSNRDYADCCKPFLDRTRKAFDPEALMRSRYTAFCLGDADYLTATLDPDKRSDPADLMRLKRELDQTMASTRWVGLNVISSSSKDPDRGSVEFAAFYHQNNTMGQLHERSNFILKQGNWYYQDGQILPDIMMGRNTPCFCGSGKKFKRCHGSSV